MFKIECCHNCTKRTPYCHSTCGDYIVEAAFNAVAREERGKRIDKYYHSRHVTHQNIMKATKQGTKSYQTGEHYNHYRRWK